MDWQLSLPISGFPRREGRSRPMHRPRPPLPPPLQCRLRHWRSPRSTSRSNRRRVRCSDMSRAPSAATGRPRWRGMRTTGRSSDRSASQDATERRPREAPRGFFHARGTAAEPRRRGGHSAQKQLRVPGAFRSFALCSIDMRLTVPAWIGPLLGKSRRGATDGRWNAGRARGRTRRGAAPCPTFSADFPASFCG